MKKWAALFLVLCLAAGACALAEDGAKRSFSFSSSEKKEAESLTSYLSDFSGGTDGWYPRSAGSASLKVTQDGLTIVGRESTWNSPGRDFPLEAGKKYTLSVDVLQDAVDQAKFMISVAHSKNGTESYENLANGTAKKGEWTTLSCTWTPGVFDNYVLYVETSGNGTIDFTIRNFSVELNELRYDASLPSLKEVYAKYFPVGTAVTQGEALDKKRMDIYAEQFAIFTPGNELKPDSVLDIAASRKLAQDDPTAVAVHFDAAKPMLDYCREKGLAVHGHVLVWHSQTPDVFFREGYNATGKFVSREVMLGRLDNYVRLIMAYMQENYPGLIVSWDVVNEAIDDSTGNLRQSNWTKVVGDDFVERAFEIARKYAPEGTKLFYNDYNTPMAPKTDGICALLEKLVAEGNIDGYGFQSHFAVGNPGLSKIRQAMERIEAMGLRLRVSELDITIKANDEANLRSQAIRYENLFSLYLEHAASLDAVQLWGVSDDLSWLAPQYPLLFDARMQPKPAFWSVVELAK